MRKLVFIVLVSIVWNTPSIGQERSLPRDYIAKQEQMLREVEQRGMDAAKDGEESAQLANLRKQLADLIEESESTDGVETETGRNFWNSALSFLFEGQAEAVRDYRRLVAVLAEAQYGRALAPLQWKIVDVHLKRIAAAAENRRLAQSQFDVGYQNLDLQKRTIEECFDAGIRFSESLFDTMPPEEENLAQRLLIASRLHTARAAYHDSLSIWSNICHRLKMGLPDGRPDIEASSRVLVYHWQARVYEFQWELKKLRNGTSDSAASSGSDRCTTVLRTPRVPNLVASRCAFDENCIAPTEVHGLLGIVPRAAEVDEVEVDARYESSTQIRAA